jgi:mono/diheme cytochrome c family protein
MTRAALVPIMALALAVSTAHAQTKIKKVPIQRTSPVDAHAMFHEYCAVCHGKDATGNGAAAADLKKPPADLTRISARNGGVFPEAKVKRYIEGLDETDSPDRRDMPLWGKLFESLDRDQAQLRVRMLVKHLKNLQTK